MDRSERWFITFFIMLFATLVMVGVCNSIGVGHFWPFPVLISMLIIDLIIGIKAVRSNQ